MIASDYDGVMLERALPRAAGSPADVELLLANAMHLPFADHSVETLVWGLMMCSVPKPRQVFEEMKRVLRPGGRVRFIEHVRDVDGSVRAKVQDAVAPAWKAFSGGCRCNRRTDDWLVEAGFEVQELERFNIGRSHLAPHVLVEATVPSVGAFR